MHTLHSLISNEKIHTNAVCVKEIYTCRNEVYLS